MRWLVRSTVAALLCLSGSPALAATLTGTVVDPQQQRVAGAEVSLVCADKTSTTRTDRQGRFDFTVDTIDQDCLVRVEAPGFAVVEQTPGRERVLSIELRLARVTQAIDVIAPQTSTTLASASIDEADLHRISDSAADLVAYAERLAGVRPGTDRIYVDGMPATALPPAGRIAAITVNADPFSAEYADVEDPHVEITTNRPDRRFQLTTGGLSVATPAASPLDSRFTSNARTIGFGVTGPVPRVPFVFTADLRTSHARIEQPVEVALTSIGGRSIPAGSVAESNSAIVAAGLDYSGTDPWRISASAYVARAVQSNAGVVASTLPEAGADRHSVARELRAVIRRTTATRVLRAGVSYRSMDATSMANSTTLGISVPGAITAGGAETTSQRNSSSTWIAKPVLETVRGTRTWSIGATVMRQTNTEDVQPNPFGVIQFASLADFDAARDFGAATGTWFLSRGNGTATFASTTAAPFAEGDLLRRSRIVVRTGVRADYQTGERVVPSPRVSMGVTAGRFALRAGAGLFAQTWPNTMFLRLLERDGHHLQQLVARDATLQSFDQASAAALPSITAHTSALTLAREWVTKVSVDRRIGGASAGLEYTWIDGIHEAGSRRIGAPGGWVDLLESNRARTVHELHARALYRIKRYSLTGHYEFVRARSNTDGAFSFPARQDDVAAEWAPASGISPHNLTIVASLNLGKGGSLSIVDVFRSAVPLNVVSGVDVDRNGLYSDRAGGPRNNGRGPDYHSLDVYARSRVPLRLPGQQKRHYVDVGVHADNLLNSDNYSAIGNVLGSPLFGRPLSSLAGRSIRFSFGLDR